MRSFTIAAGLAAVVSLAACGPKNEAKSDSTAAMAPAAMAPAPAAPTLADFAGTWNMMSTVTGTEKPVPSTMMISADGSASTMTLKGRPPIAVTSSMAGDSLIGQTAEYESVLRPGVKVTVRTASVLKDGMLVGNMVATYKTPKGEEKVAGTTTGTRVP